MEDTNFEIKCPHCNDYVIIEKINCAIFRHGVMKNNVQQINPHMDKAQCDKLKELDLIYGCGKPFKLVKINNEWNAIICDYI
jgi:hypothetical protein